MSLDRITSAGEVERLREIFDRLFASRAGWEKGAFLDLAGTDEKDRPTALPQILNPQQFAPELLETEFRETALRIGRQLLGPEAHVWFEHAIMKPPQFGAPTPWHQDEAHRSDRELDYEQISIWMPLQEATLENGCMQYLPGSHLGPILEHHSPNNDPRVSALECVGPFERERAVTCPIPAGGATIHHCRTLHCAGPNSSTIPRRAYILALRGPARPSADATPFPWIVEKRTAAGARQEAWDHRGGPFGYGLRKAVAATKTAFGRVRRVASQLRRRVR